MKLFAIYLIVTPCQLQFADDHVGDTRRYSSRDIGRWKLLWLFTPRRRRCLCRTPPATYTMSIGFEHARSGVMRYRPSWISSPDCWVTREFYSSTPRRRYFTPFLLHSPIEFFSRAFCWKLADATSFAAARHACHAMRSWVPFILLLLGSGCCFIDFKEANIWRDVISPSGIQDETLYYDDDTEEQNSSSTFISSLSELLGYCSSCLCHRVKSTLFATSAW